MILKIKIGDDEDYNDHFEVLGEVETEELTDETLNEIKTQYFYYFDENINYYNTEDSIHFTNKLNNAIEEYLITQREGIIDKLL